MSPNSAWKAKQRRYGFSIPELIAAMASAAVLLLLAGSLLYFSFSGWSHSQQVVNLRRDANATLGLLAHQVRTAAYTNITISANTLTITNGRTVQASGGNLNFTPASGGSQIKLVNGTLATFVPGKTNGVVTVHLKLTNGNDMADVYATYECRN